MQMEIKSFLADIKLFTDNMVDVCFMLNQSKGIKNTMPQIDVWRGGVVVLSPRSPNAVKEMRVRLAQYGVEIVPQNLTQQQSKIVFKCNADNDVILLLGEVLKQQKLRLRSNQLKGLAQEVDHAVEQLPYVRASAFSRGVNALKNQIEVLKNIRNAHIGELSR